MKTRLLLAVVLVLGLFAGTGCKKEYITQNYTTLGTTTIVNFSASQWTLSNNGTYTLAVDVPALDGFSETDGVLAYITFNNNDPWEALPNVVDGYSIFYYYNGRTVTLETQVYDGSPANPPSSGFVKIVTVPSQN